MNIKRNLWVSIAATAGMMLALATPSNADPITVTLTGDVDFASDFNEFGLGTGDLVIGSASFDTDDVAAAATDAAGFGFDTFSFDLFTSLSFNLGSIGFSGFGGFESLIFSTDTLDLVGISTFGMLGSDFGSLLLFDGNLGFTGFGAFGGVVTGFLDSVSIPDPRVGGGDDPVDVPAPGTLALFAMGLIGVGAGRRRRVTAEV